VIVFALLFPFTDVACLHEMSVMFACFKNNDFNEALCSKEISSFQNCYKDFKVPACIYRKDLFLHRKIMTYAYD
jgi:hypothetical protein